MHGAASDFYFFPHFLQEALFFLQEAQGLAFTEAACVCVCLRGIHLFIYYYY